MGRGYYLYSRGYAFLKYLRILSMPALPRINIAVYCAVLASPKNITHKMPLVVVERGSIICAKEIT